ncbi:hypothetical protein HZH66_015347 [Vespula vulgaris]|uniref:Uncharacterized protein n=1 Tax=Vespula vulgaris TaxID=7454 RepID=A0A834MME3_VESVU|nr:hypothetical protein HZH66_015347 [Vespula vulgaris]
MSLSDYISIFDTPPIVQSHLPGYRAATATFSQHTVATSIHTYKLISRNTALPVGPSYKLQTKQCIRPKTHSVVAPISRSDQLLICFLVVGAAAAAAAQWFIQRARIERKKEEEEEEEGEEGEEGEEEAKQEILWSGMQSPKAPW